MPCCKTRTINNTRDQEEEFDVPGTVSEKPTCLSDLSRLGGRLPHRRHPPLHLVHLRVQLRQCRGGHSPFTFGGEDRGVVVSVRGPRVGIRGVGVRGFGVQWTGFRLLQRISPALAVCQLAALGLEGLSRLAPLGNVACKLLKLFRRSL